MASVLQTRESHSHKAAGGAPAWRLLGFGLFLWLQEMATRTTRCAQAPGAQQVDVGCPGAPALWEMGRAPFSAKPPRQRGVSEWATGADSRPPLLGQQSRGQDPYLTVAVSGDQ